MTSQDSMEKSKAIFWKLLTALIAVAIVNVVFFVMPALYRYSKSLWPTRTISVSAEGKAVATPDLAQVSFSVVSRGSNPEDLADQNNKKISAVIANIKSNGVESKDIKTTGYNLSPDYQYDSITQRSFITGYTLTQTVQVKIRKLESVAKILSGATPLGVNQIGGVVFTVEDTDKYLSEARNEAFMKARQKAEQIAKASGISLGSVVNVSEYVGGGPIPYYDKAMGMGGGAMERLSVAAPTIEPGTEEVTLNVSITYEIR